jgi:hypothetical protein
MLSICIGEKLNHKPSPTFIGAACVSVSAIATIATFAPYVMNNVLLNKLVCQYFTKIENKRLHLQTIARHKSSPTFIGVECISMLAIASALGGVVWDEYLFQE